MILYDAMIVGAGPAGLSAALILGRSRRQVLVIDSGKPRNAASAAMHGFLTRDGMSPVDFLTQARGEIKRYDCVTFLAGHVTEILPGKPFTVFVEGQAPLHAKKILLATGMQDELPAVEGFREFFGHGVYLCPYCDAWELRDRLIAVYGKRERGPDFALMMTRWSRDLILLSDGPVKMTPDQAGLLKKFKIEVIEKKIARLEGSGHFERAVFKDGSSIERSALFFNTEKNQKSALAKKLKCRFNQHGCIMTSRLQETKVPGVYAAGDACVGFKMVIVAAGQGATAGFAINSELLNEEI